ncbi:UNVERIFIED_CONTAM: putative protein K02A2.6 [Sesamum latifolium]|uniref:Reverse transcriptase domain-containing protein n=1 Tax=Sesamum latifolium TaxID=2727402 RepID=A0AAW2XZZ2_9LAMI
MQLARQGKISLEEDSAVENAITIESGYFDSNKNSYNVVHGDDIEDTLLEKEDSSDTDGCMSTITFTDKDLFNGSKPHNRPLFFAVYVLGESKPFTEAESHFSDAKYYIKGEGESSNYVAEEFSSTEDDKGKGNMREPVFNRLGPHRNTVHRASSKQSIFDRLGPCKRKAYQHKGMFKMAARLKKNIKSSHIQKLISLIPSRMRCQTTLAISCGKVLKVKEQTMVFIQVQSDDEDDRESVTSSNYISNDAEEDFAQLYHVTLFEDDVFAWSYKKISGLDPKVAVHHLSVKKGACPINQGQCRFRPELIPLIETEVNKLIEVGFIREVKYPMWISSIVPVRKKNRQIRVCVDFRDMNNACLKDDFPLPIAELMIDATTGHEVLSFMDGSSGYNQIGMAPADEELRGFRTPKGIYCYKVMPFGLKNAAARYQRAMQMIFDDMLHKNIECYIDDLVLKSKK